MEIIKKHLFQVLKAGEGMRLYNGRRVLGKTLVLPLRNDPSTYSEITEAEALAKIAEEDKSEQELIEALGSPAPEPATAETKTEEVNIDKFSEPLPEGLELEEEDPDKVSDDIAEIIKEEVNQK